MIRTMMLLTALSAGMSLAGQGDQYSFKQQESDQRGEGLHGPVYVKLGSISDKPLGYQKFEDLKKVASDPTGKFVFWTAGVTATGITTGGSVLLTKLGLDHFVDHPTLDEKHVWIYASGVGIATALYIARNLWIGAQRENVEDERRCNGYALDTLSCVKCLEDAAHEHPEPGTKECEEAKKQGKFCSNAFYRRIAQLKKRNAEKLCEDHGGLGISLASEHKAE